MLNRAFTKREKILMIVLAIILFSIAYYKFIVVDVNRTVEKYDIAEIQEQYDIEEAKAISLKHMKAEMESGKESGSYVPSYNNMKQLIYELNSILGNADTYDIAFADPVKEGNTVRRNADITFSVAGFNSAKAVIDNIHNCKFRCLIREISLSTSEGTGVKSGSVSVSVNVTFFETMYGATSKEGFQQEDGQ
ncbi:MAG: hypothetical protein GX663_09850 [Clostridiales bacterium]|nr:hypothetical protein [Clostridiales bacterium]